MAEGQRPLSAQLAGGQRAAARIGIDVAATLIPELVNKWQRAGRRHVSLVPLAGVGEMRKRTLRNVEGEGYSAARRNVSSTVVLPMCPD